MSYSDSPLGESTICGVASQVANRGELGLGIGESLELPSVVIDVIEIRASQCGADAACVRDFFGGLHAAAHRARIEMFGLQPVTIRRPTAAASPRPLRGEFKRLATAKPLGLMPFMRIFLKLISSSL
jgi:hypothetical protein